MQEKESILKERENGIQYENQDNNTAEDNKTAIEKAVEIKQAGRHKLISGAAPTLAPT